MPPQSGDSLLHSSLGPEKNLEFSSVPAMLGLERKIRFMVGLGIGLLVLHVFAFHLWLSHLAIEPGQPLSVIHLNTGLLLVLGALWLWGVWEMAKGSWAWVRLLEAHSIWVRNEALKELRQTLKASARASHSTISGASRGKGRKDVPPKKL